MKLRDPFAAVFLYIHWAQFMRMNIGTRLLMLALQ